MDDWYYNDQGTRRGPVGDAELKALLDAKAIDSETLVWRSGLADWSPLRSAAVPGIAALPPPISAPALGDGIVWAIAFLPLAYAVLPEIPWIIAILFNSALCIWDERRLNRAGHSTRYMLAAAIFLVPVYLFARAKVLKQVPWYGVTWIVVFLISLAA